ncbi:MAG: carboxypeptidase-like regulatory domain-containing protein, partial [Allomuricauda sp.]
MIIPTKYLLPIRFLAIAVMVQCSIYAQKERQVTGRITTQNEALENVKVAIEGKETIGVSDSEGKYTILSAPGDILIYSHVGMETVKILVEDVTRILNIRMKPKLEQLDEVAVTAKKKRTLEEEYASNKNIVKTSFGFIDSRRSSGNIRILDERLITPVNLCILDLLRNKFANVRVFGDCFTGGHVIIRSLNSINNPSTAVFDIDGLVVQDAPIWINIDNIRRVAVF